MKRTKVDKRTVLLWGIPEEPPLALVWRALDELGVNVAFLIKTEYLIPKSKYS